MHVVPENALLYTDPHGQDYYYKHAGSQIMRARLDNNRVIGDWNVIPIVDIPVEMVSMLFESVTDEIKLTAYHAYRTLCRWDQLNPDMQKKYIDSAVVHRFDKPFNQVLELLNKDDNTVWFIQPNVEIPQCTIAGNDTTIISGACIVSVDQDDQLHIMTGPVVHIELGRGANKRVYTYNPNSRAFKYKSFVKAPH